ncbi:hypothetical protein AC1659_29200 [Rhodococcus erythropolis]|uniref:hypothetical protein n=1 Tax=Rhodococcus erythropolis TaxID=1833 RepID=UPI001BAD3603|nr:hypothetical protein [Rhodococcus erythropolis]MBS2993381.1 hypothetical protein [Rhodococcus erythropolis]
MIRSYYVEDFDHERARLLVAWYGARNLSLAVNDGQICRDGTGSPTRDPRSGVPASLESIETARKFFHHLEYARAVDREAPTRENTAQLALLEDIYTTPRRDIVAEFLELAAERSTPLSQQDAVAYEIGAELNLTQLDVEAIMKRMAFEEEEARESRQTAVWCSAIAFSLVTAGVLVGISSGSGIHVGQVLGGWCAGFGIALLVLAVGLIGAEAMLVFFDQSEGPKLLLASGVAALVAGFVLLQIGLGQHPTLSGWLIGAPLGFFSWIPPYILVSWAANALPSRPQHGPSVSDSVKERSR